jgi:glycosidase
VDRFAPGKGRSWEQTRNLKTFFGGTLWGVVENLDYVADLGATCIWLSPIFPSPTYHGYDATDFFSVDARRGGDDAIRALVTEAHSRGIRIVLDLACNHISNEHPIFKDAKANPNSPYRGWFTFDDSKVGYRSFFGIRSMPQINAQNLDARRWMLDVARFWLREFDVDGYRLDHAAGPGPSCWGDFWAVCKEEKPDSFCFGEIVDPPDVIRQYIGRMDGALDFHVADQIRSAFARRTKTEAQFEAFIAQHLAYYPEGTFLLPTFIDNHDMDRFLFVAGGDKDALRRAAARQMRLPGPPIIYYGTEVGMSQPFSRVDKVGHEPCRLPMVWGDDQDKDLLDFYKRIIAERRGA